MQTAQLEYALTAPGAAYACFQIPGEEPIWSGQRDGPCRSDSALSLMQGNSVLVPQILQLLAITPDCSTVFFTMLVPKRQALVPTLVSYNTKTGLFNTLFTWSGWADLRTRADSKAFGVLNVRRTGNTMLVKGCRIMDLKGKLLEDIRLLEPITVVGTNASVYIGPRSYDWDLDAKTIAYWNKSKNTIVIQRFDGTILDSFTP